MELVECLKKEIWWDGSCWFLLLCLLFVVDLVNDFFGSFNWLVFNDVKIWDKMMNCFWFNFGLVI